MKPSAGLPLGLLYLAAVLEKNGYTVEIYDAQINVDCPIHILPDGSVSMGDSWEEVEEAIASRRPDVAGITCPFTVQMGNAIRVAEIVKRVNKRTLVVIGGNPPTVQPWDFLSRTDAIDIVCMGEGEHVLPEILKVKGVDGRITGIPGTAERDGGTIRVNPPRPPIGEIDDLPLPAYHKVDLEKYFRLFRDGYTDRPIPEQPGSERAVSVITSRGCPYNCVFCSIHLHMGRRWRSHSVEYVLKHVDHLVSDYGVRHIHFEDDNLTLNRNRFQGILDGLLRKDISWDTPNGVRVDTLTREMLEDCKRSGCAYLVFGVESGNPRVLKEVIDKSLDLAAVEKAASWCKEIGMDSMAFYVIGFPGETIREMRDTKTFAMRLLRKYDVFPNLFVATPLPGTRLEREMREKDLLGEGSMTEEILSGITQGNYYLDGNTFRAEDVRAVRQTFINGVKRIFVMNSIWFLLMNPAALWKLVAGALRCESRITSKEFVFTSLLYKNLLFGRRPQESR